MQNSITKRQFQRALEQERIIIVGVKYTRNGWTGFRVYEVPKHTRYDGARLIPIVREESPYWSKSQHMYKCGAWGTDRRLEVLLSIGYDLGLKFNEIKQRYQWLQDTYGR